MPSAGAAGGCGRERAEDGGGRGRASVSGAPNRQKKKSTLVYTTVSPNAMFLIYQVRLWRRMCRDELEIMAVLHHNPTAAAARHTRTTTHSTQAEAENRAGGWGVDSFGFDIEVIEEVCRELGVRLLVVPFDVQNTQNHQILIEWIWHNEVLAKYVGKNVNIVITEVDVFPAAEFSVSSLLRHGACQLGGLRMDAFSSPSASEQRHLWYIHPGFMFFDMQRLPAPERMCFLGLNLSLTSGESILADTGGCSFLYLTRFQTSSLPAGGLTAERGGAGTEDGKYGQEEGGEGRAPRRDVRVVDGEEAKFIKQFYLEYAIRNEKADAVRVPLFLLKASFKIFMRFLSEKCG